MYAYMSSRRPPREAAACRLAALLDSRLFRALCEPGRIEIVRVLTALGRADVQSVAARVPQDRSVVSRHLAVLHGAGVVRREKVGRQVFFELDGAAVTERLEHLLERFRGVVAICCPPRKERSPS